MPFETLLELLKAKDKAAEVAAVAKDLAILVDGRLVVRRYVEGSFRIMLFPEIKVLPPKLILLYLQKRTCVQWTHGSCEGLFVASIS